jgi:hypothetical protein
MATWTERLSGYLATAISIVWTSGQSLASLTSTEYTILSDEVDNSTNKYPRCDVEIVLASAAFTGAGSGMEVYIIPSVDGTNYPTWTGDGTADEQENNGFIVGFATTTGTTAAQRMVIRNIDLPQGKYKWGFRNRTGVNLAASGNSATFRPHGAASTDA